MYARCNACLGCASHFLSRLIAEGGKALERSLYLQGIDLVAAGFPCTDVSRAGLRKGLQGKVALGMTRMACLHSSQLHVLC